ncbi:MAG: two-component system response regulator AtoC [Myxococcota bacterium]|jgi:two-component system response regulator AtoC
MSRDTASHPGKQPVLVIDDEASLRHLLRLILERHHYEVLEACDGAEGLALLEARPEVRIVMCDIRMPRMDGMSFLEAVASRELRVIMMSAYGNTDTAVECLGKGAYDYITKPFRVDEVRVCLERIVERERLVAENASLKERVQSQHNVAGFIGRSDLAQEVVTMVKKVAAYPTTVLFTGESGTGKELLANALHALSDRAAKPFVPINCAALPASLLESELFGHERGAFTGAVRAHAGLFEQADGGTLMLDEIGDMPLALQTRLLRVIEDGRVRRVGGSRDVSVDVRVVAATATDLDRAVAEGRFRRDLFYRLNVVHVRLPPLRDRPEDIPLLAEVLIERAATRLGCAAPGLEVEALRVLMRHPWPGNVRQLENALEHAVLMTSDAVISASDLPPEIRGGGSVGVVEVVDEGDLSIKRRVASLERTLIMAALEQTGGNRSQAARLLEISAKALRYKIRDYGIES